MNIYCFVNIDWCSALTGSAAFILILVIKVLLDFKIAHWWVKLFYWIPVRSYFRTKPINLSGKWEEKWGLEGTKTFVSPTQRHSHPKIKQFSHYCYTEFIANGVTYGVFGTIKGKYLIGEWYDKNDSIGYFGTFHLRIISSKEMKGKWIGHSKFSNDVREGDWIWERL